MHTHEAILVEEHVVVSGLAPAEDSLAAAQVKVPIDGVRHDDRIDDGSRRVVRTARLPATFDDRGLGEKDEFVLFVDDDEDDCSIEVQLPACLCVVVHLVKRVRCMQKECVLQMLGNTSWSVTSNSPFKGAICTGAAWPARKCRDAEAGPPSGIEQDTLGEFAYCLSVPLE